MEETDIMKRQMGWCDAEYTRKATRSSTTVLLDAESLVEHGGDRSVESVRFWSFM